MRSGRGTECLECFTMKQRFLRSLAEAPEGGEDLGKRGGLNGKESREDLTAGPDSERTMRRLLLTAAPLRGETLQTPLVPPVRTKRANQRTCRRSSNPLLHVVKQGCRVTGCLQRRRRQQVCTRLSERHSLKIIRANLTKSIRACVQDRN